MHARKNLPPCPGPQSYSTRVFYYNIHISHNGYSPASHVHCNWQMKNRFPCLHIRCMAKPCLSDRLSHGRSVPFPIGAPSAGLNRRVQTVKAVKRHHRQRISNETSLRNNKYWPIPCHYISSHNGGTCSHTSHLRYPESQAAHHPSKSHPSRTESNRNLSDP